MSDIDISRPSCEDEVDTAAQVEIKGDHAANDSATGRLNLSSIHMWALGVCLTVSGIFYAWNIGLEAGFGSYIIGRVFISTAYVSLILSISELSSGLPFAGGAYGIARVTLGPFAGYMVACYESMETVLACAALIYAFAKTVVVLGDLSSPWELIICAMFYLSYVAVHSWGGRVFWNLVMAFAVGNLLLAVIYLLGSAKDVDIDEYAAWPRASSEHQAWFRGGLWMFVRILPSCCNGFTCIGTVNLACKDVQNPKRDIPRGFVASVLTQAVFCLAVVLVSPSIPPGIFPVSRISAPLTFGYMEIFNCTLYQAYAVSLPAMCASVFGRMFAYSRQISAMGKSGMLHPIFGIELQSRHTPLNALLFGSSIGFGLCVLWNFQYGGARFLVQMTSLAHLAAFTSYIAQLCSFIMFQGAFSIIKREFISPFGIIGAVYAMFWFALCFISLTFFQDNNFAIIGYAIYTGVILIHYFTVVRYRQMFSDEEKEILFRAHLVKNNRIRAMKIRKGKLSPRHPPYDARIQNKNRSCAMVRLSAVDSSPPAAVTRAEEGERGKKKEGVTDTGLTMTPLGCMHEQERPQFGDNQHSAEDAVSNRNLAPEDIHPARTASASILANENRIDGEKYFPLETAEEDKNPPATTRAKNDASHGSFIYAVLESITANVGAAAGAMSRSSVSDSSGRVAPTTITTLSSSRTTTQHHDQQEQQKQLSGSTYNIDDMEAETFKASVKHKPSSHRGQENANAGEGTINFYNSAPTTGNHACTLTTVVTEDTAIDGLPG